MNPLPSTVRVAGQRYRVRIRGPKHMEGAAGLCRWGSSLDILKGQPPLEAADTLIHEAFHAILHGRGRTYGGPTEERYVSALSAGLIQLIRDNPKFGPWLASLHKTP